MWVYTALKPETKISACNLVIIEIERRLTVVNETDTLTKYWINWPLIRIWKSMFDSWTIVNDRYSEIELVSKKLSKKIIIYEKLNITILSV